MNILSLGEKIKKLRKEKNMTLKELAGDRITAAQISHIERDKSHTSYELLEYLSERLGVSVDYLLETKEMQSRKITDNLILQSEIFIKCGELDKAQEEIHKIMDICLEYDLSENFGKCNYLLATINFKKNDYSTAVFYFEKALFFFIKNNDKQSIFDCYLKIGNIYVLDSFYKGALTYFTFAEEILEESKIEDVDTHKELYSKISQSYMKLNRHDKSLEYIEKINELDSKYSSKEELEMLVLKARALMNTGQYVQSKECFSKALEIMDNEENKDKLAEIYLTVGSIYADMGDNEKHLEYSQKVYDIKKNDGDKYMMNSLFNIIESYIERNEYDLARKYCKLALASSIKHKDKYSEYKSLKYYSDMYKNQEDIELAIEYIIKCVDIAKTLKDDKILANLYIELGQLYSSISKEKELEYYQRGVELFKNLDII